MSGRVYIIQNGRKVLQPTELQMKRLETAALLNNVDIKGFSRNELLDNPELRKALMEYIKEKYTPEELYEILKKGLADSYDFAVIMAIRAYLDEKNGLNISEMFDASSKWNLNKLIKEFAGKNVEYMAMYDRNNRFIGYNVGTRTQVSAHLTAGMLANGTMIHNHPIDGTTRIGGGLSICLEDLGKLSGDILYFRAVGLKEIVAGGREGTWSLKRDKRVKISLKEIKQLGSEWHATQTALFEKFSKTKASVGVFRNGIYGRAYAIEQNRLISSWAQKKGMSYTFTPNKGFEDLLDPRAKNKPLPPTLQ